MADGDASTTPPHSIKQQTPMPTLEDMQHWTWVIGQAQQMMLEHAAKQMGGSEEGASGSADVFGLDADTISRSLLAQPWGTPGSSGDPLRFARMQADFWADGFKLWHRFLEASQPDATPQPSPADRDRRFAAPQWRNNPGFDLIRQSYLMIADHMLKGVDTIDGVDDRQREQIRFATRTFTDAMSPSNFALTNPLVLEKTLETRGSNLLKGLEHMLADMGKGQLSHTDPDAFEVGRNIATTPGKVVRETPLYQLIQYAPTTAEVFETPLIIFPPWINRFYILDLSPEKSFIKWAVDQGLSVFVVSWKSADASMADVIWDDYILRGQIDAIETVRELLEVDSVHTIGYCVAGTTLAATLALLAARGKADMVASATFFTAQVDFAGAGDLTLFVDDDQMKLVGMLGAEKGYLDGRYMAMTFNLLRGRDLIWNYVVNNYLLGQDYLPFDLLHWNGDTTNLPAKWHCAYLQDLYRDNKLVQPGGIVIDGTPIDLGLVKTAAYIQAGREDHIAPARSVWELTRHLKGPIRFVLAGSGHIAGVVNPPSSGKYQYWTTEEEVGSLDEFVDKAQETKGSWWPDWARWLAELGPKRVAANGARIPGEGRFPAIEDAPGRYVRER